MHRLVGFTLAASLIAVGILAPALPAPAQDNPPGPAAYQPEMTPATRTAIERCLEMLARRQRQDGSYEGGAPVATSALCGLAFLASGSGYDRGPYATNIRRCVKFLRESCQRSGYITERNGAGGSSGMHGHGYATLFLAEACGTVGEPEAQEELKEVLVRAVRAIEGSQNQYGGWNAGPDPRQNDDGSGAVAVMQISALRAARNAGVEVDKKCIDRSVDYVLKITTDAGWTQYNIHNVSAGRGSSALTGAGMTILNALGLHENPKLKKGIANLISGAPMLGGTDHNSWQTWYHYTAFYATLAIFQTGGAEWRRWWPAMREDLIKKQAADGSWAGAYGSYGPLWSAFACLTLEMPYRYLPLFSDGGRGNEGW